MTTMDGGRQAASAAFTLFPALDLRQGRVVRLAQGDPDRQTVYGADPLAVAERWRAAGARWLHVVNLDGAFGGPSTANLAVLQALTQAGLRVQYGGGLRDQASLRRAFDLGVARVVLGTAAVEDPPLLDWALAEFGPERVAAGLDARDGQVRVRGWAAGAGISAVDLGRRLARQGVAWCVFTDVARDGVGGGVNVEATAALAEAAGLRGIASGGVAGLDDVVQVREAGLAGVIAGRALYEGKLDLAEALGNSPLLPPADLGEGAVCLRPPRLADLDFIRALWADRETMAPVGGPVILDDAQARRWYARLVNPGQPSDLYCLVWAHGQPVGEVSFHRLDPATMTADFNVKILAARRGRGYGRAAMRLLLDHFFNHLGGRLMTDDLAPDNLVGQAALRRFGWEHDPGATGVCRLRLTRDRFNAWRGGGGPA